MKSLEDIADEVLDATASIRVVGKRHRAITECRHKAPTITHRAIRGKSRITAPDGHLPTNDRFRPMRLYSVDPFRCAPHLGMNKNESAEETVERLGREAREAAGRIPFDQRAALIRAVVNGVRDGVKFDPTLGGAPEGREWEMDRLDAVKKAAEDHYFASLSAKQARAAE
jgi:hypothetical protein